jgi:ribosomal-protein-alanine N-acetyltransferase
MHMITSDSQPILKTKRLRLRAFTFADAKRIQVLAGHADVAAMTASLPHPYPDGAAESWIANHAKNFAHQSAAVFAIEIADASDRVASADSHNATDVVTAATDLAQRLIGCISLTEISHADSRAELGYWIGIDDWNKGYCSEAAAQILQFGFEVLNLNKITSRHLKINPSSGRVMVKSGMRHEGTLRQEFRKNGRFHDLEVYGILKQEFRAT